jgi:NADH:ubiquinone oxidoreductase subunit 6 (subunit J)
VILASAANVVTWIVWIGAAFATLASGAAVVSFRNPFYSALALIGNLASLAVLFLLASAEFVAAAQVLVYAGAVMVMFLFVIAYIGREGADPPRHGSPSWQTVAAIVAAAAILVEVVVVVALAAGDRLADARAIRAAFGSPGEIGRLFLTDHLLAFEITSIVLLVAAVGGVILGAHSRQLTPEEPASVVGPAPGTEETRGGGGPERPSEQVGEALGTR